MKDFFILSCLVSGDVLTGKQIKDKIKRITGISYACNSLYPTLKNMHKKELIKTVPTDSKLDKAYQISEKGLMEVEQIESQTHLLQT